MTPSPSRSSSRSSSGGDVARGREAGWRGRGTALGALLSAVLLLVVGACSSAPAAPAPSAPTAAGTPAPGPVGTADAVVRIDKTTPVHEFDGGNALGAGIDGLEKGEIDRVWTPHHIDLMKSAGFGPISFRLRTELGVKAWHWHNEGTWSEGEKKQGYWVSKPTSGNDPGVSYGYDLPRRGNTIDQAKNSGYSRLTDGDLTTYWKSNPYLEPRFTKEPGLDPQWVMFAFDKGAVSVDTLRIAWGNPYARSIRVQYWEGSSSPAYPVSDDTSWVDFPTSRFTGRGGVQTVRLAPTPMRVQYVRVELHDPSGTAIPGATDERDALGFAIRELSLGTGGASNPAAFKDKVVHRTDKAQTRMYASSTDPWHREQDLDGDYEHASFKRVFDSGLTKGKPLMVPVPVLYGVPEDAAALLRYLREQNYPVTQVEIGEEPDGQLAQPEHYAALYTQVADELRKVDPKISMGGPGYQTVLPDWLYAPNARGEKSYTGRFVSYLRARNRMADLGFFSFEWYPFDDVCADTAKPLLENPHLLEGLLKRQEAAGLPRDIPKVITELGYSSFAGQAEVELTGPIVNAEATAKFLQLRGQTVYFYGLEPNWVFQEDEGKPCNTWGNLMLLQFFNNFETRPVAAYYVHRMVNTAWVQPGDGKHTMYAAAPVTRNAKSASVTAYAVRRPDGTISVLLFNKHPKLATSVRLEQRDGRTSTPVTGALKVMQYSGQQYVWDPTPGKDSHGRPAKNDPPVNYDLPAAKGGVVGLPQTSVTVVHYPG